MKGMEIKKKRTMSLEVEQRRMYVKCLIEYGEISLDCATYHKKSTKNYRYLKYEYCVYYNLVFIFNKILFIRGIMS